LCAAIHTLGYVTELLEKQETTLAKLRQLLCPASTEKTAAVLQQAGLDTGEKKQKTSPARSWRAGASQRAGAAGRDRLRTSQAAV
jgi:hypothetical protein